MEPKKILFNINDDLKSSVIKYAAYYVDGSKDGVKDGNIDESEKEELTKLLSQNTIYQDELKNEAPNIAKIFGYTQTVEATTAGEVKAVPNTSVTRYSKVLTEYTKLRQEGKGPYEAYKKVEEKYEDKDEFKSALKELEVKAKEIDAQIETIMAIGQSKTTESKKQVKRDAKAVLEKQDGGKIDKWHKRAINGNNNISTWASGQDSPMKEVRGGQLYDNRAEKIKKDGVTMEAIVDRLGENCPYLQKVQVKNIKGEIEQQTILEAANLIKKRDDGKYDISVLSDLVKIGGTGSDNSQSRQQNKTVREQKLNIAEFNVAIKENTKNNPNLVGYPDGIDLSKTRIKDKYSKRLVRLTGRHVEPKNVLGQVYENTVGGAIAGGLGTLAALFFSGKDIVKGVITNKNHLDFTLELDGFSNIQSSLNSLTNDPEIQKMLQEGTASITTTGTKVNIVIDQTQTQPFMHVASKHLERAIKGAAVGAAIGLLSSALSYGRSEQEVIPNKTDCKTYDEYVTYIDSLVTNKAVKPLYGEIAKQVALSFTDKNGNMDCNGMNKFLGYEASNGSRLSRAELMRALIDRQKELQKPVQREEQQEQQVEKPKQTYCGTKTTVGGQIETEKAVVPKTPTFEDWGVFASRYQCLENRPELKGLFSLGKKGNTYNPNGFARRMMKIMQAITDNNYDINRLKELTEISMKNPSQLKNVEGFSYSIYEGLLGSKKKQTFTAAPQKMPKITVMDKDGKLIDACPPSQNPLYKIGKQSGGTGKKVDLGDAHNRRQVAKQDLYMFNTSDNKVSTGWQSVAEAKQTLKSIKAAGYEKGENCKLDESVFE